MALSKRITDFHKRGMQAVKRAAEAQNKPSHYVGNGGYNGYERIVSNKTFNPVHGNAAADYASNYASNYNAPSYNSSGSTFTKAPSASKASAAPRAQANTEEFNSPWSDKLQAMYDQIANRPKFSYDQASDPLYQQYAEMYRRNARLAMDDTVGRAAALTGGYGNSYAETAGQAMYNQQMDNLNARALDLYNAALDTYEAENQNLYNKFNLAGQMYNNDYNEWRARIADSQWAQNYDFNAWQADVANQQWADNYNFNAWQADTANQQWQTQFDYDRYLNDRNYNYQLSRDAESDRRYNSEWEYQLDRDRVSDERYADELAYSRYRDAVGDARYAVETAYNRQQNDLDRALQYYQARYNPETGGMSELGQREYNDELAFRNFQAGYDPSTGGRSVQSQLEYLAANGNTEGVKAYVNGLSGLSKSQKDSLIKQYSGGNSTGGSGTGGAVYFSTAANQLIDDALTRSQFEGRLQKNAGKYKTNGKTYLNYEDYMEDVIDKRCQQKKITEDDAIQLYKFYGIY
ncbi:MAG: hypothetical protein IJL77_04425 [Clostridia bacterium]|nr:hypothetical protein [Clostridia bacterium]